MALLVDHREQALVRSVVEISSWFSAGPRGILNYHRLCVSVHAGI